MNPLITVGGVFLALFLVVVALVLVARRTKWKPTTIKPVWAVLGIVAADVAAGLVCSLYGGDIHILYWWLLGLPIAAVCIPLIFAITTLGARLFYVTLFSAIDRCRHKR